MVCHTAGVYDSWAKRAGIAPGDLLTAVNDMEVLTENQLQKIAKAMRRKPVRLEFLLLKGPE